MQIQHIRQEDRSLLPHAANPRWEFRAMIVHLPLRLDPDWRSNRVR
ncbi:MAG TPA: hypothetical protein V6D10_08805 [Trichocoleus sp.]